MSKKKNDTDESLINLPAKVILAFAGLILGFLICRIFVMPFTVNDSSMEPILSKDQRTLVFRFSSIQENDIVLAKHPLDDGKVMIKRVVAVTGDTVEIRNKVLYVNGQKANSQGNTSEDSRNFPLGFTDRDMMIPIKLEKEQFFLMGDNRDRSYDSRELGPFTKSMIKGKVFHIFEK